MKGSDYSTLHHRGHGGHRGSVSDDTTNSVPQVRNIEVDKQSELITTEFQVSQNLSEMERQKFLHSFKLQDHAVFDHEVDAICGIELNALINDRKSHLMPESNAILCQLIAKTRVVRAFKASSAERCMYLQCGSEHLLRDRSVQAQLMSSVSSVVASVILQMAVR